MAAGPYEVPNVRVEGTVVYTNNPPCGAMRGFGAAQVCFAHEAQMDKLARALGIDPVELRLRNAMSTGSVLPTGQVVTGAAPVRELIERLRRDPPAGARTASGAATLCATPGARATSPTARGSSEASASRSATRTWLSARVSTTPRPPG